MQKVDISKFKGKKTALVFSGGVVKAAAWHLGVSLALDEFGFCLNSNGKKSEDGLDISTYVGSSAGALISLYFASGFRPIDIIAATIENSNPTLKPITYKDMLSLTNPMKKPPKSTTYDPFDGLPFYIKALLTPFLNISGLFSTHGLHRYIQKNVIHSDDFSDYSADLFVVATQLDHSRKVIFSKFNYPNPSHDPTAVYYTGISICDAVAASMSVPPFYAPYPVKNSLTKQIDYYIDGEIRETLSTHVAIDNGCEIIISSWTHTPYHYHDEIGSLVNYGIPAICIQAIYLLIQKKIVDHRSRRLNSKDILETVSDYMKKDKFTESQRKKITSILEQKLNHQPNLHLIDIYPSHENYNLFFKNSFSLNADKMAEIIKMGYKRTYEIFRQKDLF